MNICLITPDRRDRPEFLEHCRWQMKRQTLKADHFIIDDEPKEGVIDLVPRIKKGLEIAKSGNFDYCFIIENDDYYPDTYLENMIRNLGNQTLIGIERTTYYSLETLNWRTFIHPGRSSLFCSGFKVAGMSGFEFPHDETLYFDLDLWKYPRTRHFVVPDQMPIGIKHGIGFCPGNFHQNQSNGKPSKWTFEDPELHWLKSNVRRESYDFYLKQIIHASRSKRILSENKK
jgi:hypothetical protein